MLLVELHSDAAAARDGRQNPSCQTQGTKEWPRLGGASAPSTPELEGGPRGKVGGFEEPVGLQPAARAAGDSGAQEDRHVLAGG